MSRRARDNSITASLFPFLAVLLSTMGVLVVLLVVMASVQLDRAEQKRASQAQSNGEREGADLNQLRQQLEVALASKQRVDQTRNEEHNSLRRQQLRISQIEENIRRWQDRLETLRTEIAALQDLNSEDSSDPLTAKQRLDDLERKIASAKQAMEEMNAERNKRPPAYAILPYEGPNGTHRRPIYIECLADRVVIQPTGIELFPADFHPELGAGNPLAAALRAAREYYVQENRQSGGEPYPLILVRPDGVGSYREVLGAIDSWDSPFGYEMVAADWKLDFGAADPALTLEIAKAVDNARDRQHQLAEAAPAAFAEGNLNSFETSPSLFEMVRSEAPYGRGTLPGETSTGVMSIGNSAGDESGELTSDRLAAAIQNAASTRQDALDGAPDTRGQPHSLMQSPNSRDEGVAQEEREGTPQAPGQPPRASAPGEDMVTSAVSAGSSSQRPETPADPNAQPSASNESTDDKLTLDSPESQPADSSASVAMNSGNSTSRQGNDPTSVHGNPSQKPPRPGLAVERPIQIVVQPDRLIVIDDGEVPSVSPNTINRGRTIKLDKNANQVVRQFSTAVKAHMEEWGIAGEGSYWKAVLVLNVAPGGERLADELAAALRASGVVVRLPNTARR